MRPSRPPLLALALAVVVVAGTAAIAPATAAPPAAPPAGEPAPAAATAAEFRAQPNTTNYLAIEESQVGTRGYGTASIDVGTAVRNDVESLEGTLRSAAFRAAFRNASSDADRTALVRNATDRIARERRALASRQRQVLSRYNQGQLSTEAFLREMATIDATADRLDRQLMLFTRLSRTTIGYTLPSDLRNRIGNVRGELTRLRGPVRDRAARAIAGNGTATEVYVVSGTERFVLTTTGDRTYLREAYVGAELNPRRPDRFAQSDTQAWFVAYQRTTELYPWVFNNSNSDPDIDEFGNSPIYFVGQAHNHGRLETFLNGGTRTVFLEHQYKRVSTVPTDATVNETDTLRLTVNRTHSTGPMKVSLHRPLGGGPVNGTVTVNGHTVGTTGPDGVLWTVTPYDAVRLNVTTSAGESVTLRFFAD